MHDDDEKLINEGSDPWTLLVNATIMIERLVLAHNELAEDHEKVVRGLKRAEAKIEELRRAKFGQ